MATKIIHLGADECHRMQVLTHQGYSVLQCDSIAQLYVELMVQPETDAVIVEEEYGELPCRALSVIRSSTSARLILFKKCGWPETPEGIDLDLVIPGFTPTQEWIGMISALFADTF